MQLGEFAELVADLNKGIARIETVHTTTTEKIITTGTTKSTTITGIGSPASLAPDDADLNEKSSSRDQLATRIMGMFSPKAPPASVAAKMLPSRIPKPLPKAKDEAATLDPLQAAAVDRLEKFSA